jgi:hypothetical protein
LKQKFLEQLQMQRLSEDARQSDQNNATALHVADQRNATDLRQIDAMEGLRRTTQEGLERDRRERGADRDAARDLQSEARFQGRIRMMPRGARITGEQAVDFAKFGASPMLKPATNSLGEPEFEFGGTQDAAEAEARAAADKAQHDVTNQNADERLGISQALLEIAKNRPSNTGQLSPSQQITQTRLLRNEYQRATTSAREMSRQLGIMDRGLAAAEKGNLNAGSQAVLVTFQKILDPNSVVRESEYGRSQTGLGLLQKMQGVLPRIAEGGPGVPVAELKKFAALARQMTEGVKASAAEQARGVRDIATSYGLNADLIAPAESGAAGPAAAPAGGGPLSAEDLIKKYGGKK